MLKTRIMPTLLYKDLGLVKGKSFDSWRRVGSLMQAIKVYNMREVDELIFLDITASNNLREPDYELVKDFAYECFMPLTIGGGISCIEHVRKLLKVGADKVSINSAAVLRPELIKEISCEFGSQCIVISIDAKKTEKGFYEVFTHSGSKATGINAIEWAKTVEKYSAGEILITSIDSDGSMNGYDLDLIKSITSEVNIPVIASGGAGNYNDMYEAISIAKASAVAAASIFHFTEQTPIEAKKYLSQKGIPTRL